MSSTRRDAEAHFSQQLEQAKAELAQQLSVVQAERDAAIADKTAMQAEYQEKAKHHTRQALQALKDRDNVLKLGQDAVSETNQVLAEERTETSRRISKAEREWQRIDAERLGQIKELQAEIDRLSSLRFAQGGTDEAKLSRRMHSWLESTLGIRLHHLKIDYLGANKHKFVFVNQSAGLKKFDALKDDLSAYISLPIVGIKANPDEAAIEITVCTTKVQPVKADEISRLVHDQTYFLRRSNHWPRAQFLAPSESGKTSSCEIIASEWAKAKKGKAYLHFPNEASVKNYLVSTVASKGTDECVLSFVGLVKRVDAIQNGSESPLTSPEYHIFDDSDTVISKSLIEGISRDELLDFFTRASHCNIGFVLIGHSTGANRIPGMQHSDFNNLVRVYSGSNIMTALENTQVISSDRADSLKRQYEKIRDYYEEKNERLGLITMGEKASPGAYRFVLVVEPSKAPYFCELPPLDLLSKNKATAGLDDGLSLEGDSSHQPTSGQQQPELKPLSDKDLAANSSHLAQQPSAEKSSKTGGSALAAKKPSTNKLTCPNCGSENVKKGSIRKGKRRGQCLEKSCKTNYFTVPPNA